MSYMTFFFSTKNPMYDRFLLTILFLSFLICAPSQASANPFSDNPSAPITEAEAVRIAMARPAVSGLIDGQLAFAESALTVARLWPNPELQYAREQVDRIHGDNTEDIFWISQQFEISGARGLRKDAAQMRLDGAHLGARTNHLAMEADARRLFHRLLYQHRLVLAGEDWATRISNIAAVVEKRERAGEVSGYDALRLSRERASVNAAVHREQSTRSRLWASMIALLGGPDVAGRFDGVTGELLPDAPPALADLLSALDNRPDIVQLEREVAALELERRAGSRGWVPDLTLGAGQKRVDDDLGSDTGPIIVAGITIPLFNHGQADEQRASAQAEIARNRHQLLVQKAQGDVTGLWREVVGLRSAALEARQGAGEEASRMIRIAETAYEGGELGVLELLDAYRSAYLFQIQALELSVAARLTSIELDQLTGGAVE
jgi:cobalt-zinc-cadmium efflux system outer membrane protein